MADRPEIPEGITSPLIVPGSGLTRAKGTIDIKKVTNDGTS